MKYTGWELKFFDSSNNFRKYQYEIIKKFIGRKVLEIGPGSGVFAKDFLSHKAKRLVLSEINPVLYKKLVKNFKPIKKVKVVSKKIKNVNESFNSICYFDVLEHIDNHEAEILSAIGKLKKNGHLIICVPAHSFLYSSYDRSVGHYRRYEKDFFVKFAKEKKLSLVSLKFFDSLGFILLVINKIMNVKRKNNVGLATFFWNKLMPISKIIDKLTLNNCGKSLLCVYKKT